MRTSTTNANEIKKHRLCYKILAAAVWILVWQLASMWLKQEILLESPVSAEEILMDPLITVIKATPVASFIILCLIWIPSRNLSVFISFLMVFPVVYTNLLEGLRQTDKQLLEMADSFGAGLGKKVEFVYLSQVMPYAATACKLGLGLCWKAGIAAEVIGIPTGSIGEKLYKSKVYLETPDLFAWTIVIIFVSMTFEKIFLFFLKKITGEQP